MAPSSCLHRAEDCLATGEDVDLPGGETGQLEEAGQLAHTSKHTNLIGKERALLSVPRLPSKADGRDMTSC